MQILKLTTTLVFILCLASKVEHTHSQTVIGGHLNPETSKTRIFASIQNGETSKVIQFLDEGDDPNVYGNHGQRPLMLAIQKGNDSIFHLLLKRGASVKSKNIFSMSSLHIAATTNHVGMAKELIELGAKINDVSSSLDIPLHLACASGNLEMVKLLIKSGSIINYRNATGSTPLMFAVANNHVECVRYLVSHNVRQDYKDCYGKTAKMIATSKRYLEILKILKK